MDSTKHAGDVTNANHESAINMCMELAGLAPSGFSRVRVVYVCTCVCVAGGRHTCIKSCLFGKICADNSRH